MLTYQIRQRIFRLLEGGTMTFPSETEMTFLLEPVQAFGMEAGNGRTCIRGVGARLMLNQITGQHAIQSEKPLGPLEVKAEDSDMREV